MIEFPYKKYVSKEFGVIWKPYATVRIVSGERNYRCQMLIDSGADITLIPNF